MQRSSCDGQGRSLLIFVLGLQIFSVIANLKSGLVSQ